MDKERFETLLPWLANDTLAPEEREQVVAYLAAHPEARRSVEATAFALASLGGHPDEADLYAFAEDRDFDHRGAVIAHLAACADCAEAVALARVGDAAPVETPAVLSWRPARRRAAGWRSWAAAASIAVATGGLGWWQGARSVGDAGGTAPPTMTVHADPGAGLARPLIVALAPSTLRNGGVGDAAVLELADDRDGFILEAQLPQAERAVARLAARLVDEGGETVALTVGPRPSDDPDWVAVPLPAALLAAGASYQLEIADADTGRVLDRYPLRTP